MASFFGKAYTCRYVRNAAQNKRTNIPVQQSNSRSACSQRSRLVRIFIVCHFVPMFKTLQDVFKVQKSVDLNISFGCSNKRLIHETMRLVHEKILLNIHNIFLILLSYLILFVWPQIYVKYGSFAFRLLCTGRTTMSVINAASHQGLRYLPC